MQQRLIIFCLLCSYCSEGRPLKTGERRTSDTPTKDTAKIGNASALKIHIPLLEKITKLNPKVSPKVSPKASPKVSPKLIQITSPNYWLKGVYLPRDPSSFLTSTSLSPVQFSHDDEAVLALAIYKESFDIGTLEIVLEDQDDALIVLSFFEGDRALLKSIIDTKFEKETTLSIASSQATFYLENENIAQITPQSMSDYHTLETRISAIEEGTVAKLIANPEASVSRITGLVNYLVTATILSDHRVQENIYSDVANIKKETISSIVNADVNQTEQAQASIKVDTQLKLTTLLEVHVNEIETRKSDVALFIDIDSQEGVAATIDANKFVTLNNATTDNTAPLAALKGESVFDSQTNLETGECYKITLRRVDSNDVTTKAGPELVISAKRYRLDGFETVGSIKSGHYYYKDDQCTVGLDGNVVTIPIATPSTAVYFRPEKVPFSGTNILSFQAPGLEIVTLPFKQVVLGSAVALEWKQNPLTRTPSSCTQFSITAVDKVGNNINQSGNSYTLNVSLSPSSNITPAGSFGGFYTTVNCDTIPITSVLSEDAEVRLGGMDISTTNLYFKGTSGAIVILEASSNDYPIATYTFTAL